jgi:D-alanyl-D-alanine carboxypeptidase (penicillin-binding protein 5/6)
MKKIRFLSFILAIVMLLSMAALATDDITTDATEDTVQETTDTADSTSDSSADTALPSAPAYTVKAKAAILIELNTDQVLLEQDADKQVYPASLTKIMTCLLTLKHGNLSDVVTVSESALENLSIYGSTAGLQVGEQLTVEELLYCMMLSSANEACNVAAEYIAGSVDAFVDMMNEEAASLGCTGTHFANPHGLHDENHYTTARDLSLITREALKNETFRTITSTVTHEVPATNLSEPRTLTTTNLLETPGTQYYYEYASGVKTGFTTPAGLCLISTADNGKLNLLSVVCGAEAVQLDNGEQVNENFTETKALFEYGFSNFAYAKVLDTMPIAETKVLLSAGPEVSLLAPTEELTALLPAEYDETKIKQDVTLKYPDGVEAPVKKGQVLGSVTVSYEGRTLGTVDLAAITDVARSEIVATATTAKSFFGNNWWKLLIALAVILLGVYLIAVSVGRSRRRKRRQQQRQHQQQLRRQQGQQTGEVIEFPGPRHDRNEESRR